MKVYADLPARRTRQVLADGFILVWVVLWMWIGQTLYSVTSLLAAPGVKLSEAGNSFTNTMTEAAGKVDDLPLLGDAVAAPFNTAAGVGNGIADSGNALVSAVHTLALVLGWTLALSAIVPVVAVWALTRIAFIRQASAAQRLIDNSADLDLFALRALANQPLPRLARISHDPAGDWRRGDRRIIEELARVELSASGLRPPRISQQQPSAQLGAPPAAPQIGGYPARDPRAGGDSPTRPLSK